MTPEDEPDELTGGEWRLFGATKRWVRDPVTLRRPLETTDAEGKRIRRTLDDFAAYWEAS